MIILFLELNPTPSEEICQHFNELRSDMVLLMEIKSALTTCDYELQSLRHQYEALAPGKVHNLFVTFTIYYIFILLDTGNTSPINK